MLSKSSGVESLNDISEAAARTRRHLAAAAQNPISLSTTSVSN
jgi:hypothetical protein